MEDKGPFKSKEVFAEFHKHVSLGVFVNAVYFLNIPVLGHLPFPPRPSVQHGSSLTLCLKPSPDFLLSFPSES